MKKTTKLSVGTFLGLSLIAYGQTDGKVGINTLSPNATLEIKPNTTNLLGATNEGIIVPKLSKTRVAKMPSPQEGTLVYVVDDAKAEDKGGTIASYTGTDAKVEEIIGRGYYFFNGTKWVGVGNGSFIKNIRRDDRTVITIDKDETGTPYDKPDYFVHLTGDPTLMKFPAPEKSKGRVLCFYNPSPNGIIIDPQPLGQMGVLDAGMTACYISDGVVWMNASGY
ncbi:hypothetical protein JSO61_009870 [Riemerella anatipestifer]|uniref:hypothetical protein n=1 Tax=Riemerella anatipestifer TaxID=34085 RepID=UPI0030C4FD8C